MAKQTKSMVDTLTENIGAVVLPDNIEISTSKATGNNNRFTVQISKQPPEYLSFTVKDNNGNFYEELTYMSRRSGNREVEVVQNCWLQRWNEATQSLTAFAHLDVISNKYGVLDKLKQMYLKWKQQFEDAQPVTDHSAESFGEPSIG